MKRILIRFLSLALLILMLVPLASCDKGSSEEAAKLSFKAAMSYDFLKTLDGKQVTINGYMATSSPVDGSFLFLMNLPYQSCPFCKPNTSELSNTMEVYPKKGSKFDTTKMTQQAIKVTGKLMVAPEGKAFNDPYGYEFSFKIVDAQYTVLQAEDMDEKFILWQSLAESDVITEIYRMYDYLNFVTSWGTYSANFESGKDYVWPSDAKDFIKTDGKQFNYGYQKNYFSSLIARIERIDATAFAPLTENIRKAEELSKKAVAALEADEYEYVDEYSKAYNANGEYALVFGDGRKQYRLKDQDIIDGNDALYNEFADWLGSWEM